MAKTSKIAKAPKSFKSYALNKCLIGYGVVNGIINAAIFAGINAGAPDAMFGMHDIVHDLAFTGLLLVCCCSPASCRSPAWICARAFSPCPVRRRCLSARLLVLRGLHSRRGRARRGGS